MPGYCLLGRFSEWRSSQSSFPIGSKPVVRRVRCSTPRRSPFVPHRKILAAPAVLDRDPVRDWSMLLNNQISDCTCAGMLHMVQLVSAINGYEFKPTDTRAKLLYEKFGYVPGDPSAHNCAQGFRYPGAGSRRS